jgi:hypothetical protein
LTGSYDPAIKANIMPERPFVTVSFTFAPETNRKPVCKFFNLIRLGAVLAGENLDQENFFCGLEGHYINIGHTDSPNDYGTVYQPRSSCQEMFLQLKYVYNKLRERGEKDSRLVETGNVLKLLGSIVNRYGETNYLGFSVKQCIRSPREVGDIPILVRGLIRAH